MSATNQPRSDAVLKNLTKERQHEIYLRRTDGEEDQRSLAAICAWLREDGLKVTPRMLSEFLSWYADRQDLQSTSELLETFEEFTRKSHPDWNADKVRDVAIQFFMAHTVAKKDPYQFATVLSLDQQERFGHTKAGFKEREIALKELAHAESKKDDQTKALERCLAEAKAFPDVQELFKAAFAALKKARGKK